MEDRLGALPWSGTHASAPEDSRVMIPVPRERGIERAMRLSSSTPNGLGGSVHLFPLLSAIVYSSLGLVGNRLVSVLFFSRSLFFLVTS